MHRLRRQLSTGAATLAPVSAVGAGLATPALAQGADDGVTSPDPCKLVKKKEAKKILGAKIVEVERERDDTTGARSCEWVSDEYSDESFEESDSPYSLELAVQPMTDEVREVLDTDDDLEPIEGLGDEAYLDQFDVIVVVGDRVLVAETHNWAGDITPQTDRAQRAAEIALGRL